MYKAGKAKKPIKLYITLEFLEKYDKIEMVYKYKNKSIWMSEKSN